MHYLKHFGMIFCDSTSHDRMDQHLYSFLLLSSSACSLILFSSVAHEFDDWSEALSSSMSALTCCAASIATIISRLTVLYNAKYKYQKYKTTLEGFEIYTPMAAVTLNRISNLSFVLICTYVLIILPTNGVKLWNIFNKHGKPVLMTTYFALYYFQNLSLCFTELHFIIQCIVVLSKFRDVNMELKKLKDENKRFYAKARLFAAREAATPERNVTVLCTYEKDFYCPKDKGYPMTNGVELLRIKHWLSREAINDLNGLFGIQMGLSLTCLVIATLFAVYTELFIIHATSADDQSPFRSESLFIGWMLQYTYRFSLIVISAHITTKQAVKTKMLVAQMNNRYLDFSTQEELQMFYNQLSITSIKLTIFDIFALNNSLFTSAIALLATYILLLVQIHFNPNKQR